jgi:hypothetical protein
MQIANDTYKYVPIAMHLNKMLNVLQTCPYVFFTCLKTQKFKQAYPTNLDFLGGMWSKTKVGACVETTQKSSNVNLPINRDQS